MLELHAQAEAARRLPVVPHMPSASGCGGRPCRPPRACPSGRVRRLGNHVAAGGGGGGGGGPPPATRLARAVSWNPELGGKPAASVPSETNKRVRSSPRCSTSSTRSPWPRRRRRKAIGLLVGALGHPLSRLGANSLGRLKLDPAGDRLLELPHPAAERAVHLGDPLRAEDEQQDDEQDQKLGNADEAWHGGFLFGSGEVTGAAEDAGDLLGRGLSTGATTTARRSRGN